MTVAGGGGIFLSYRRQESSHLAGRLYDRLMDRFGEGQVFIDVDTIEPGVDFAEEISRAVAACQVLVAIIGPTWLTATDGRGRRRLDDPDDIVRREVEAALACGVRVIPILTENAAMPTQDDLPESLMSLARRNALSIRHESFRSDAVRLITAIERVLTRSGSVSTSGPPDLRTTDNPAGEASPKSSTPTRDDAARATRLLDDAERIASSIAEKPTKAAALSVIAQAIAATDPDRAERTASSITARQLLRIIGISLVITVGAAIPFLLGDAVRHWGHHPQLGGGNYLALVPSLAVIAVVAGAFVGVTQELAFPMRYRPKYNLITENRVALVVIAYIILLGLGLLLTPSHGWLAHLGEIVRDWFGWRF